MDKQVLCFGEILWDTFAEGKKPGGAPMNVAMHLKQQQMKSSIASCVGQDEAGNELISFLNDHALSSDLIQSDPELPTCVVTVDFDEDQQPNYTIPDPVSWDNIQLTEALEKAALEASVIVFGSLACRHETTRTTLHALLKSPALKVFDVNIRAPYFNVDAIKQLGGIADVIKLNADELDTLAGTELAHFSQQEKMVFIADYMGCDTICVTRGENGAILLTEGDFSEHPGFKIELKDSVGAGDAFLATLIRGLLEQQKPADILKNAAAIGAFVASSRGANPQYDRQIIDSIARQAV